jgi:hypothetical protein
MSRRIIRIVFYNFLVLFVLANITYWAIPIWFSISEMFSRLQPPPVDSRARLPNYAGVSWAEQHFRELAQLKTSYKSYIGWRRKPFEGETIVVAGPYAQRQTGNDPTQADGKAYFFGGSTMWGTGSRDAETIPSHFAAVTGMHAENFGESAYVAHQSLVLLIQLLQEGHRPDLVVFYDGANEVDIKCRADVTPTSNRVESRVIWELETPKPAVRSFAYYFAPLISLAGEVNSRLVPGRQPYDCHLNSRKAEAIAENLIQDWTVAKRMVESYGGQFVGGVQPCAYLSKTRLAHLTLRQDLAAQFQVVYPLILQRLARSPLFHDLTVLLDVDEYVYVDFCHVSPNGNRRIAASLAEIAGRRRNHNSQN